jgi:hypothetical protein
MNQKNPEIKKKRAETIKNMDWSKIMKDTHKKNPNMAKQSSERMKKNNPMSNPENIEKMRQKLIGRTFLSRGGNGKITPQQEQLFNLLGEGWIMELPVLTEGYTGKEKSLPNCYKVDIGNPILKLLIEIDGRTHTTKKWKYLDKRKTEILTSLGWKILRFWNKEVTTNPMGCVQKIQEFMI